MYVGGWVCTLIDLFQTNYSLVITVLKADHIRYIQELVYQFFVTIWLFGPLMDKNRSSEEYLLFQYAHILKRGYFCQAQT